MKTLTVSGYNRPDYFAQVVHALSHCDGASEYQVWAVLDPCPVTWELVEIAKGAGLQVIVADQHLGCGAAIRYALELGFAGSAYHIHLEDDTVPSVDALRWFEWAGRNASAMTLTVSGYNQHGGDARPEQAGYRKWFTPWGWATWADHFYQYLAPAWDASFWDGGVQRVRDRLGMGEVFPKVSRMQNIGATRGTFCPSEDYHRENQLATRVAMPEEITERWVFA